jgi:hypothetical protein
MVRALTSTLTAALNATTRCPVVSASVEDHIAHYQLVQTPAAADSMHDACLANDGSIIRVRVTRGSNPYTQSVQWQHVNDPTNAAQWSTWTTFAGANANCFQDGSCAVANNGGTLRAFAQQGSSGSGLITWSSSDNGLSWSSSATVALAPPGGSNILGIASAGNNDVFCLYQSSSGVALACSFYSGGSWSAVHSATTAPQTGGQGVAAVWDGSKYWLVASDTASLYEYSYNPTTTSWQAYPAIVPATSTAIRRGAPRLQYDAVHGLYNLISIEIDDGTVTGSAYQYPRLQQSSDLQHWSQGFILPSLVVQYGAGLLCSSSTNYIVSMSAIYRALNFNASNTSQVLDISGAILSYVRTEKVQRPATLDIVLDNNHGQLVDQLSQSGATQPLGPNCSLILHEGYRTGTPPSTNESIKVGTYRIQCITVQRTAVEQQISLHCSDLTTCFDLLNRFQITYSNQSIAWLLRDICTRTGIMQMVLPTTAQMSNNVTSFVLQAGKAFRSAIDELCAIYALDYFLDQDEVLQFRELSATDSAVWSYQAEIEQLTLGSELQAGNHIIVTGRPPGSGNSGTGVPLLTAEAYDNSDLSWTGQERLVQHVDQKLTSVAQCASKAAFILAQEQRAQHTQSVTIPLNPALQLLDVISINDMPRPLGSGLSSQARIVHNQASYHPQNAEFTQIVQLAGV